VVATAIALGDLVAVGGIALGTYLAWLLPGNPLGPLRVPVGVAFVLVAPGYVVTAALFPGRGSTLPAPTGRLAPASLSHLERLVCSVGLSVVTVPLVALYLNYTKWGIDSQSVVLSLLWFVLVGGAVAAIRRFARPPSDRFRLPVENPLGRLTETRRVNLVIAALFVCSVGVAGTALATAGGGERFTEFSLLTEDDETGELVASDYPETLATNDSAPLYIEVRNHEGRPTSYTVLAELHRFGVVDGEREFTGRTRLKRLNTTLGPGEFDRTGVRVSPPASGAGERIRVTFLLYRGEVGKQPPVGDAYRSLHVWVDVPARGGEA